MLCAGVLGRAWRSSSENAVERAPGTGGPSSDGRVGQSGSCSAVRRRNSSLVVPGDLLVAERVEGDALNVLNIVLI